MSISDVTIEDERQNQSQQPMVLFSWLFAGLLVTLVALLAVSLEKPHGSMSGRISLEEEGFNIQTYDLKQHHAYAVVDGPRQGTSIERGVYVNSDGTFKIDNLPVGEYELKVRAKGFATVEKSGVFVDEGKITKLSEDVAMDILEPSVTLGQHARVFTSSEQPTLFANTVGADSGTLKIYKTDLISLTKRPDVKDMLYFDNDLAITKNMEKQFSNPCKNQKPVLEKTFKLEQDSTDSARAVLALTDTLPPGDYIAYAQVTGLNGVAADLNWFSVSNVGLVIKRDAEKVIARAVDLETYKPVKDCAITILDSETKDVLSKPALTGADGTVSLALNAKSPIWNEKAQDEEKISSLPLLFVGTQGLQKAYGNLANSSFESNNYNTYFYTDKSVYRLGQKVLYKAISRTNTTGGYKNPGANLEVDAAIEDPDNNEIWNGKFKTNAHGTLHGEFTIPAEGKTGAYQFHITYPDGSQDYGSFEVAEYRKPEYQVEMTALTPRVAAGEPAKARLKASYYFGAPVANAKVKYSIYSAYDWSSHLSYEPRPDYYDFFDSWSDNYSNGYDGELLEEGTATTDENGEAVINFVTKPQIANGEGPLANDFGDTKYTVKTEVTDISRMTVEGSTALSCVSGDFMLFASPTSSISKVGDKINIDVSALDYSRKAVANQKVDVTVRRWPLDSATGKYRVISPVANLTVTTDAQGKASLSVGVDKQFPSDEFYITAHAQDARNHSIYASSSVWIANDNFPYVRDEQSAATETLTIRCDKEAYKPGDVAHVMITAPVTGKEGIDAIVTVEGLRIYNYKVVNLKATAVTMDVPISAEYAPNVFLDVAFVGKKHEYYSGEQMLKVSPKQNFLDIKIATDKEQYKPGDEATYTITAKHQDGTPASNIELSLGVIDESVYAIRAEQATDIRRFYYKQRDNLVTTGNSFPLMYTGGPDKIEPRVRKNFKDTAAWVPELVTDKDGVAKTTFKLPDNLTTWRATVRGIDMSTQVGSSVQKIIATQDFILRLALPRFFSQGDEGLLTAIIHNYTKQNQTVKINLTASDNFDVKTAKTQELKIEPDKAARYSWPITVTKAGTGTIKATAIGDTAGDAMETQLPIRPLGIPAFSYKAGMLANDRDNVDLPLGLSSDADKSTFKGLLSMSSSTLGPVLGTFDKLIDYPYGCTEQTMSRLIPSVVAMQLHKNLQIDVSDKNAQMFAKVQKLCFEKLAGYHHADGGWGWWAEDPSNSYLTSYVVQGLGLLKISDYKVDDALISSGLNWLAKQSIELQKQMDDPKRIKHFYTETELQTDLARMLYTLSVWNVTPESLLADIAKAKLNPAKTGAPKSPVLNLSKDILGPTKAINPPNSPANKSKVRQWLLSQSNVLAPEALTYLTLTCKKFSDDAGATLSYKRLTELANAPNSGAQTNWDHTLEMTKKIDSRAKYVEYDYRFTGVETTALALKAVLTMEPDNSTKIEAIKQWLLLQRDNNGWSNTKTTAEVFQVLLQEELQFRAKAQAHGTVATNFKANATQTNPASPGAQQLFAMAFSAANTYEPESITPIPLSMMQQSSKLTISKDGPGRLYYSTLLTYFRKLLPGDQSVEKGLPQGLLLTRKFYRLVPVATKTNGTIHFRSEEIADGRLKAGETIMMRMFVDTPVRLPYIKLEAALPSGAEVVKDSRENSTDDTNNDKNSIEGDWSSPWWTHQDILDDRIVYFGGSVPAGKSEFHTMLRMEMPGNLQVNPVSLEGMYTNKIRAYSGLDSLRISD